MRLTDNWFNGLAESEAGQTAHLHVRDELEEFRATGKYRFVIEIAYLFDSEGIEPSDTDAEQIEAVDELLQTARARAQGVALCESHIRPLLRSSRGGAS